MSKEALNKADQIIMDAYINGFSTVSPHDRVLVID